MGDNQARAGKILGAARQDPKDLLSAIASKNDDKDAILAELIKLSEAPTQDIGRSLAAALPVGIAAALGGFNYAGPAAIGASNALQQADQLAGQQADRELKTGLLKHQTIGDSIKGLELQVGEMNRGNQRLREKELDFELAPINARRKAEATFEIDMQKRRAGRTQVVVNPMDQGPALDEQTFKALTATNPSARFQGEKIAQATGTYPTMSMTKELRKNPPPKDVINSTTSGAVTLARMKTINNLFENIKDENAFVREVKSRFPEFSGIGNKEQFIRSQVGSLAMQMAVEIQGTRPTDSDRIVEEKRFTGAGANAELGTAKMRMLIDTYELTMKARKAAYGMDEELSPEEIQRYETNMSNLFTGDDNIAGAMKDIRANINNDPERKNTLRVETPLDMARENIFNKTTIGAQASGGEQILTLKNGRRVRARPSATKGKWEVLGEVE